MAGIFRPLKKNLTNPMFDQVSATSPANTMPASLVQAATAAPSVPLSDPQKAAQIQSIRPSTPASAPDLKDQALSVVANTVPVFARDIVNGRSNIAGNVAEMVRGTIPRPVQGAANVISGIVEDPVGAVVNSSPQIVKDLVSGAQTLHNNGVVGLGAQAGEGIKDAWNGVKEVGKTIAYGANGSSAAPINLRPTPSAQPAAVNLRPAAIPAAAPTVAPAPASPVAGGDAMLPGAIRPGNAAGLRPGEARFFDPRTGTNMQVDTNAPTSVQGPAAWDQAGIEAAKADPARQVHFVPRGPETRDNPVGGPTFNLRPRKATELAQVQGAAANTVAETQGKSAVEVAKQNTQTAVESAKATEAEKTRRAGEVLQGKQVEADGRVAAAKAGKADVTPGAAKNSDAALSSIDTEINGTMSNNGKTVVPGLAQKAADAKKKAEGFWGNEADKKVAADLADQLAKAQARRQALIDGMTGGAPAAQAPETSQPLASPNQAHIDLLLKNPAMAKDFDAKFGPGASSKYLTKKG
jgi:hypothetical protein